jgi:hypothetical protein
VAFCNIPAGATPGSNAAAAGLSKAVAAPNTVTAAKISGTFNQPAKLPHAENAAVSPATI